MFAYLPMHDAEAADFVVRVPENDRFKSFHVIDPDSGGLSRGAAVVAVGRLLAPRALRAVFRIPGLTAAAGVFYWVLVKAKPLLGRMVPDRAGPYVLP